MLDIVPMDARLFDAVTTPMLIRRIIFESLHSARFRKEEPVDDTTTATHQQPKYLEWFVDPGKAYLRGIFTKSNITLFGQVLNSTFNKSWDQWSTMDKEVIIRWMVDIASSGAAAKAFMDAKAEAFFSARRSLYQDKVRDSKKGSRGAGSDADGDEEKKKKKKKKSTLR
eukprot:Trichotokara_eunicae@DN169_c0_g1_i1.p1